MHTLIFDLQAPEAAFEALKDLAAGLSAEEVESGAQRNADGEFVRAKSLGAASVTVCTRTGTTRHLGRCASKDSD
jgi:hypothetical protein